MSFQSNETRESADNPLEAGSDIVAYEQASQERDFSTDPATPAEIAEWTEEYLVSSEPSAVSGEIIPAEIEIPTDVSLGIEQEDIATTQNFEKKDSPNMSNEKTWPGKEDSLPPPFTPEFIAPETITERNWLGKEDGLPPPPPGSIAETFQSLHDIVSQQKETNQDHASDEGMPAPEKAARLERIREVLTQKEEEQQPLSKAERMELLSPEVLSELSTEEYVDLWRRLSPHYVSHVTRQGYRETWSTDHSEGAGEFHNNFKEMLTHGKSLKSSLGIERLMFGENFKQEGMMKRLEEIDFSKLEPRSNDFSGGGLKFPPNPWEKLYAYLTSTLASAPRIPDELAVHLATEAVVDGRYGAETNNQIFAIYPSDMIASQYEFAFNGADYGQSFTAPGTESRWNDVFVWNKNNPTNSDILLDAGIVFLPRATLVDPTTGSKYAEYKRSYADNGDQQIELRLADQPVTSEEYWNTYFKEHPDQKPRHVVFYDGNPTQAVEEFMSGHGITPNLPEGGDNENLDFDENRIRGMRNNPKRESMERPLMQQAALVLIEFFAKHPELDPDKYLSHDNMADIQKLITGDSNAAQELATATA